MTIKGILLAGVAVATLATVPAFAKQAPKFHVLALHAGHAVNKTALHHTPGNTLTYTFGVSSYVPSADLGTGVNLIYTYYKWNSSYSICTTPKEKMSGQKKSTYGKIKHNTETYSLGCSSGPTKFYGDNYTLTKTSGFGQVDTFSSLLTGKFKSGGKKYTGKLTLDVSVDIGS
jgi:hypothetical protein